MFENVTGFIKDLYSGLEVVPLHAPLFIGNEKKYVLDCIDSTYVSSVGEYVNRFEKMICDFTGAAYAVATVNGTSALQVALDLVGVKKETEVITQALTFVATANAIIHTGAEPVFIDSASNNLGMCPESLEYFLVNECVVIGHQTFNKKTKKRISACVPMHVLGHPVNIDRIKDLCDRFGIPVVEDAAESLGSVVGTQHTGLKGKLGVLSFNGNKIVTTGGGGMIVTNDVELAKKAKHITTTAKVPHPWEFYHDEVGYNFRMPNLNAALGCAQLEHLRGFVEEKRQIAQLYRTFFKNLGIDFIDEPAGCRSNFWLNAVKFKTMNERDQFLAETNRAGVMTRPLWRLMIDLPAFSHCQSTPINYARIYSETVVNIPSGVRPLFQGGHV